ncbi:MAG: outer membrane beta-barrel protein, partial [Crocinitomicaceae bacterium]
MKYLLLALTFLAVSMSYSQETYKINGAVLDTDGKVLDLCSINLFLLPDSSFVKTEYTDEDGTFLLSGIAKGKYFILVKQYGYEDHRQEVEVEGSVELPDIQLGGGAQDLEQVEVTHKVPFIERKIDRVVVTPDALIANAGSSALEVLERAPGVTVDQNGVILLKGRSGVAIFINDKPSYLSGTELENYLRTLPAGSIKNIEIMENPPAKYEAEGNAGVININVKRSTMKGLFGNTAVSYKRSRYNTSNNSLNLNYNRDKISAYANVYAGFWRNYQDLNINRYYLNQDNSISSSFEQNSYNERGGRYLNGKVGLDFYPTEKSNIGIGFKSSTSPSERAIDNTSLVRTASGDLAQRVRADNLSESTFRNNLINAYYSHSLDSLGSKISVDADYVNYQSTNDQLFKNFQYNANDQLTYEDQINGEIPSEINIYALKSDYSK